MNPGQLDRLLTIQRNTGSVDALGQRVAGWTLFAQVWGRRVQERPREGEANNVVQATRIVKWRIRYQAGIRASDRLLDDEGRIYDIHGTQEIGRRHLLDLTTEEFYNDGT